MSVLVIEIINVADSTVPTARGSYQRLEVTYKNKSYQDKVESKPLIEPYAKKAYAALKSATFGEQFFVKREKNEKGFWDWIDASKENDNEETETMVQPTQTPIAKANVSPKSTYETSEERAARQVMIVRQSSISSAVALLAANGGKKNSSEEVLAIAKDFEAYVFGKETSTNPFSEMEDDVPL